MTILDPIAAAQIHWDVSRELVRIGPIALRWYGLAWASAFIVGFFIVRWMYRREQEPEQDLDRLLIYMILGAIIGARLGHCLFYHPGYYLSHPLQVLAIWRGGLASHGGALGILTALYLYSRSRPDQAYLWLLDRIAAPTALGGAFIRLGNLMNSEILGTPTDLPWAVVFLQVDRVPRHPAQVYESLAYAAIFGLLLRIYIRRGPDIPRGLLAGTFLLSVFTARFLIEFVKQRQAPYAAGLPLSVGQLLSLPLIAAGGALTWRALARDARLHRPG